MTPRAWWRQRRDLSAVRTRGYRDGFVGRTHRWVGREGSRQQAVYDLAWSRGRTDAYERNKERP